jgi:hypothetical protein
MSTQRELAEFDMLGYNTYICGLCGKTYSDCKEHTCFKGVGSLEDIMVWPNEVWCYREELESITHMSDDYEVLVAGSPEWQKFVDGVNNG